MEKCKWGESPIHERRWKELWGGGLGNYMVNLQEGLLILILGLLPTLAD